ncbi:MAG: hypothetical protein QM775_29810 [Pirellulales bacterium]
MGPYVTVNTVLIGFFAFAALHYGLLWWFSRSEKVYCLFAATTGVCAILLWYLMRLASATTIPEYLAALDQRSNWSLIGVTLTGWVLSAATGVQARRYLLFVTAVMGTALAINVFWFSLAGPIDSLYRLTLPWGEQITLARRPDPAWWGVPIYVVALSVDVFGLYAGYQLSKRDRLAGAWVIVAMIGDAAAAMTGVMVDLWHWEMPYVGDWPYVLWVIVISVILAREYRRRREDLLGKRDPLSADCGESNRVRREMVARRHPHVRQRQLLSILRGDVASSVSARVSSRW